MDNNTPISEMSEIQIATAFINDYGKEPILQIRILINGWDKPNFKPLHVHPLDFWERVKLLIDEKLDKYL